MAGEMASTFLKEQLEATTGSVRDAGASTSRSEFAHWARQAALVLHAGTAGALQAVIQERLADTSSEPAEAAQTQATVRVQAVTRCTSSPPDVYSRHFASRRCAARACCGSDACIAGLT